MTDKEKVFAKELEEKIAARLEQKNNSIPERVTVTLPDDLRQRLEVYEKKQFNGINVTAAQLVGHLLRLGLESVEPKKKGKK